MFYDNFKEACERKGTNISTVLSEINRASGNTGSWKIGKFPRLDIVMEMAEHLEMSLDDLVYGSGKAPYSPHKIESDGPLRRALRPALPVPVSLPSFLSVMFSAPV